MDLKGQRFGRWTVLEFSHKNGAFPYWLCQCDCGTVRAVKQLSLQQGTSKSCGCYQRETAKVIGDRSRTHGDFGTRLYRVWAAMKNRCFNPNMKFYHDYGGRGITVCDEWLEYIPFKEWALANGYEEGLTIDRIDVNGNYCPENCHWVPMSEQHYNKRDTVYVEYNGKRYTIADIAEITGLKKRTIRGRIQRGWTPEQIFSTELKKNQY